MLLFEGVKLLEGGDSDGEEVLDSDPERNDTLSCFERLLVAERPLSDKLLDRLLAKLRLLLPDMDTVSLRERLPPSILKEALDDGLLPVRDEVTSRLNDADDVGVGDCVSDGVRVLAYAGNTTRSGQKTKNST